MKKAIILVLLAVGVCAPAQNVVDVVTLKNGSIIKGNVVEMHLDSIVKVQTGDGSLFVYKVGEIEAITKETQAASAPALSSEGSNGTMLGSFCFQAEQDCKDHYKGAGAHVGGIVALSLLLSPIVGLIPAATAAGDQPDFGELGCPSPDLYRTNFEYKQCYDKQAKSIRTKKAWTAWGITLAANIVIYYAVATALGS